MDLISAVTCDATGIGACVPGRLRDFGDLRFPRRHHLDATVQSDASHAAEAALRGEYAALPEHAVLPACVFCRRVTLDRSRSGQEPPRQISRRRF